MVELTKESAETLYEMGKRFYLPSAGVADPLLAFYYFGQAAEMGYAPAQRVLGTCYLEGRLTAPDYAKARQWLTAAVNQKDEQAAYSLALIYAQGLGVPKDWELAYQLLDMEGARELPDARVLKEKLKNELISSHPVLADRLRKVEEQRRAGYNATRKRFIQPWFTPGRLHMAREEFSIWLKLNLRKIKEAEAHDALLDLMTQYYNQVESLHH